MANAGRVAIVPKGEYNSATAYKRLDLVRYNNAVYVAKKANTGVSPTKTDTWMLCIQNVTQEQYDDLISGAVQVESAKEADNALLLGNLTAKQVGESGAKNLIPYPYRDTTNVVSGITFTDNGDGSITVNGTATALAQFYFCVDIPMGLKPNTTYTLTGCPSGGSSGKTYQLRAILNYTLNNSTNVVDIGNGKTFTTPDDYSFIRIMIDVSNGATVDNLTFKPMLELGSVAHDFVPYHFGGAEDAAKLNGLTAEEFVSNENLLVNGYFLDAVNSSGVTTITGTGASNKNFIDGWQVYANSNIDTFEVTDNGIKLTNHGTTNARLLQKYSIDLTDQVVTLSLSITELTGTLDIYSSNGNNHSQKASISTTGVHSITFNMGDKNQLTMQTSNVTGDTTTIEWAKLELGSIATPFIPPNKEVEKLKCGIVDMPVNKTSTDLDQEFYLTNGVTITKYTGKTLNTPYMQGLTDAQYGKCITSSGGSATTYAIQLALPDGKNAVYVRDMTNGKIGKWVDIADGGNADTVDGVHVKTDGTRGIPIVSSDYGLMEIGNGIDFHTEKEQDYKVRLAVENGVLVLRDSTGASLVATQSNLSKYLPLDGSVPMSGNLTMKSLAFYDDITGGIATIAKATDATFATRMDMYINAKNDFAKAFQVATNKSGSWQYATILHTKNSAAVVQSTTAPSDTSAVWVDTANKVTKIYKDGAWTALA